MNVIEMQKKNLLLPRRMPGTYDLQDAVPYIEPIPDADYERAPEESYQAFRDIKFAVRIHWGPYSKWGLEGESWRCLKMSHEDKQRYQQIYRDFRAEGFDAEEWMQLFEDSGIQCLAFTTKHHDGFSMFHTKTKVQNRANWTAEGGPVIESCDLHYSIEETPYHKDVVKEICDSAHRHNIKIDLYYSHPDWYDADFRPFMYHPMRTQDAVDLSPETELNTMENRLGKQYDVFPNADDAARERMMKRHRQQLLELVTNYGHIDMLCLDMWLGQTVWSELRETIKQVRRASPKTMLRARGIDNYGDYYTPEGFVPGSKENTNMPWMCIYPLAASFSYDPCAGNYKGAGWMVYNLIDCVSKGGGFMVGIGPDGDGRFHPSAVQQLLQVGQWLKKNGRSIYGTKPRDGVLYMDGTNIRYTKPSDDDTTLYAFLLREPGESVVMTNLEQEKLVSVCSVETGEPLDWNIDGSGFLVLDCTSLTWDGTPKALELKFSSVVQ